MALLALASKTLKGGPLLEAASRDHHAFDQASHQVKGLNGLCDF